jgi:hypothetical protein
VETVEKSKERTFPPFPPRLEIPPRTRDFHIPTATMTMNVQRQNNPRRQLALSTPAN